LRRREEVKNDIPPKRFRITSEGATLRKKKHNQVHSNQSKRAVARMIDEIRLNRFCTL